MNKLQGLREELKVKNDKLAKVFEEAGKDIDMDKVTCLGDGVSTSREKAKKVEEMNLELNDLGKEIDALVKSEKIAQETKKRESELEAKSSIVLPSGVKASGELAYDKTFGELFVESKAYKNRAQRAVDTIDMGVKTLFQTSAGWSPESTRTGRVVYDAQRAAPKVVDIVPIGNTGQNSVVYMEETTFTNNAAEAAEGASYGEAALVYTEQTSNVRKIAVFIPTTDEQLEDEARISSLLDNRLRFMIQQRLDLQLLVGDGTAPNLEGINSVTGIQTQALGSDSEQDAIYKAMTLVRTGTGRAEPSAVVMHPNDWQTIRLQTTTDGIYLWGSPSDTGADRIFGVPVIQSTAQTENTALVGDFANFCELVVRKGVEVQVSDSHDDYFIKGKKAIRAQMRCAFPVYRPAAFCTVTGI